MNTIPAWVFSFITLFTSASSCEQVKKQQNVYIKPFEVTLYDSDYSLGYSFEYHLSERTLTIQYKGGLVGERDSIVYKKSVDQDPLLRSISEIDFANLKEHYENNCIQDGSQITFVFRKDTATKQVHLSNYYHRDIGSVVRYLNNIIPREYLIEYDSIRLTRMYNDCKWRFN